MKTELYRNMRRFFAEDSRELVESIDHSKPVAGWCEYYEYAEKKIQLASLEDGTQREVVDWKNLPGRYFPGGYIVKREDLPRGDDCSILRANAECNGWEQLIRTRNGRWLPYEEGDVMIQKYTVDNELPR